MDPQVVCTYLDSFEHARPWLARLGLRQPERGHANFLSLAATGITLDLLAVIAEQLQRWLPGCPDPDMALNNFDRYIAKCRSPLSAASLFERDPSALKILIQLFSTSQHFSDLLVLHPDYFEQLRFAPRSPPRPEALLSQLQAEADALADKHATAIAVRRFCQLHTLRIGCADVIWGQSLELVTRQLSDLADCAVQVALTVAQQRLEQRHGAPRTTEGRPSHCAVLAMGKLGGRELNYSSDIDLIFLYDDEGQTAGPHTISNQEFFGRVVTETVKLLAEHTERGHAYRVDLRLRPEGARGPLARTIASTLRYYDVLGRTWERQALIKARCIAGHRSLGEEFLNRIEPWIYRNYLSFAEISEIKALKRRIEHKTSNKGESLLEVKTGFGGIRDIEFAIQFLQLLNGGDLPDVRSSNTLIAMQRLERAGCLTDQERHVLDNGYRFLRNLEHRLQIMFGLQTHRLPDGDEQISKLARRMASVNGDRVAIEGDHADAAKVFRHVYRQRTELNRRILDHLLHEAFLEESEISVKPEVDLILQPEFDAGTIQDTLSPYRFSDPGAAYRHLMLLAKESVPFLSSRRCRHFLASIAPGLLRAVAQTPDPDSTLLNLEKVSDSLGAKAVLWELFSFNPATMRLFVQLCASSQFLVDILTRNPGMIDDLMDSLVLNQPRSLDELHEELVDLCRGAEDPLPILHAFKNKELLRIGVRDILGKDPIEQTNRSLSDLAEVILAHVAQQQYRRLAKRLGTPMIDDGSRQPRPCQWCILALGKLGGREMTYHSDLDIVFLYEADGATADPARRRFEPTTNFHFFSELGQRIIRTIGQLSPHGRLYEVDARLRPTGKSGSLCIPLAEFRRYYEDGLGQLWERQALTRARIAGSSLRCAQPADANPSKEFLAFVEQAITNAAYGWPWQPEMAEEIASMRRRLEASRSKRNIKRAAGALADIEFLVQMLQLKHSADQPAVRTPNTPRALHALKKYGMLTPEQSGALQQSYRFLRTAESRLRMMRNVATNDLPDQPEELDKLARHLGYPDPPGTRFLDDYTKHTHRTRQLFDTLFLQHGATAQ